MQLVLFTKYKLAMLSSSKNTFLLLFITLSLALLPAFVFAQENKSYPASKFPDRIILGWKGDAAHSQAVNWRTDSTVTKASCDDSRGRSLA